MIIMVMNVALPPPPPPPPVVGDLVDDDDDGIIIIADSAVDIPLRLFYRRFAALLDIITLS